MADFGSAAHGEGIVGASVLWAYGLWWLVLAVIITLRYLREGLPFNMGRQPYTFSIGVHSVATLALGRLTGVDLFEVFAAVFVMILATFWIIVTGSSLHGVYHGHSFFAPCLCSIAPACACRRRQLPKAKPAMASPSPDPHGNSSMKYDLRPF